MRRLRQPSAITAIIRLCSEIDACHALNLLFVKKCFRHIFLLADKIQELLLGFLSADLERNDLVRQIGTFQPLSEHNRIMAGGERADETEAAEQAAGERESEPEGEAVYYSCPSCGAEI